MNKIDIVCRECGSQDVRRDAWAEWDVDSQEWVLADVYDYSYCLNCEGDATLAEVMYEKEEDL